MQAKTTNPLRQKRVLAWILSLVLILGLLPLFYFGYCFGLWGNNSLLLQYFFQRKCQGISEEWRYPQEVDVIVPAGQSIFSRLSPSGHLLYVLEQEDGIATTYLLDLQSNEKISFAIPDNAFYFLTDNLLYIYKRDGYILDRITGEQYPIRRFVYSRPDAYIDGATNVNLLIEALREAKYVFLIHDNYETVVALAPDFLTIPEHNFLAGDIDLPTEWANKMEQFLQANNILYQNIPEDFPHTVLSPNGRFTARDDGIYLAQTNQKIASYGRSLLAVRGWTLDGQSAIYSSFLNPCVIETNWGIMDDDACYFEVPQPVLKLKVPEEYLSPNGIQ